MTSQLDTVRQRFHRFAEQEAAGNSPLYERFALGVAEDAEVADLLTATSANFAVPTLFFAAAQRALFAEPWHPLTRYYPSVGGHDGVDEAAWPEFRDFVLGRADKMRELISSRTTQTNEVRRAAVLYPVLSLIAAQVGKAPLGLLEVGASAGLLLGMDRYGYRHRLPDGTDVNSGRKKARLVLDTAVRREQGRGRAKAPAFDAKVGLDLTPVDVADEEQLSWLEACVWPDQPRRLSFLRLAAEEVRADPPVLVAGDAVDDLYAAAARVPADLPLVVFNSNLLAYVDEVRRADYVEAVRALSESRTLWWVAQEPFGACLNLLLPEREDLVLDGPAHNVVSIVRWEKGRSEVRPVARSGMHGQWVEWL
ncbi:DUF2332 domain-containing protein [Allokutzneria sp. NRRL B-24872]|uniref:DUF2332 domain-containing protein n=1 Tax=Allokutzneria sp. NRRL B-24872 TaxID=1137961 RepID=UPI000A368518|nr:DUF2332 domain-containing protein [Allokutzneria sp. NRRL B-24872]